jgi:hexosaminidase
MFFVVYYLVILSFAQRRLDIVPYPQSLEERIQNFTWVDGTTIIIPNQSYQNAVSFLADMVRKSSGVTTRIVYADSADVGSVYINCSIDEEIENDEGYFILVDNTFITVTAKKPVGIFYAFQTLRQLLPVGIESSQLVLSEQDLVIPGCVIEDYPRYRYRGFMLDVCRHFFEFEDILRYLDILALHKINTFHFHLTDGFYILYYLILLYLYFRPRLAY